VTTADKSGKGLDTQTERRQKLLAAHFEDSDAPWCPGSVHRLVAYKPMSL